MVDDSNKDDPSILKNRKSKGSKRLENLVNRYKGNGLDSVARFVLTKSNKSKRTALTFAYGLDHLNRCIQHMYKDKKYNISSILEPLRSNKIDRYELLDNFVSYMQNNTTNGDKLSPWSLRSYMIAARSYLQYHDVEIVPSKFKTKVSLPTIYREDEESIDATDIKNILNHCNNRRLKAYLLVLASGGMRAIEALAMRERDLDFSGIDFDDPNDTENPAGVKIRWEYAKNKKSRHIFISNEAARYLHDWIEYKYRDRTKERKYYKLKNRVRSDDDLIFSTVNATEPLPIYFKILEQFQKVLQAAGLAARKDSGVYNRRKITFHSFRRFVRTTIANQTGNTDYGEWLLGHSAKSVYYTNKPEVRKRIYAEHCQRYLTFLDYPTIEATGKSYEAKLKQKDQQIDGLQQEIAALKQRDSMNTDAIGGLTDKFMQLMQKVEQLEKQKK